jgi:hypothetical protein
MGLEFQALQTENTIVVDGDQAIVKTSLGSERYIRHGSDLCYQTYGSGNFLKVIARSLRVDSSWVDFFGDTIGELAGQRMIRGQCRLSPGLQVLGDINSYSDEIVVELWSDAQPKEWNSLMRVAGLLASSELSEEAVRGVSAKLSYRGANSSGRGNWSLVIRAPEEALLQIERALFATSLQHVSFTLRLHKAYLADPEALRSYRKSWNTFSQPTAYFMYSDVEDETNFWGEIAALHISTEDFNLPQKSKLSDAG